MTNYNRDIPPEEFARIWREAEFLEDVAERTGRRKLSCTIRAKRLRALGWELAPFKRGPKRKIGGGRVHGNR